MTTLTNSEGKILNYTNEFIETILLQLNSSNNYYTTGDDDVLFIKIGSTKVLLLDYTYHINRTIFQNYNINENTINAYGLEFVLNNTSNEYDLQSVYNGNSYIGIITDLQQVFLAIYDISVSPSTYTGSENIDITNNEISLNFPLKINDEIVLNPRAYGIQFEMYAGTSGISFLQNISDGAQPIAIFNSLDKSVEFFGNLDIPNFYNKTEVDAIDDELSALILNTYTKPEVEALISNINLTDYYTKTEIDTSLGDYSTISYLQDNYMTSLLITQTLMNNYASITFIIDNFYSKTEIDTTLSDYYSKSEIDTTFSLYSPTSQILSNFYSKLYIDNLFITSAQIGTLYYNKTETDNLLLSYVTGSYVDFTFYNKTQLDNLLLSYATGSYVDFTFYNKSDTDYLLADKVTTNSNASLNTFNLSSTDSNNYPLVITNNGDNWYQGEYIVNNANIGCIFRSKTAGSSAYWWNGP